MYCEVQSFNMIAGNSSWDGCYPVAVAPVFIMPQHVPQQVTSRQRRQHQMVSPSVSQSVPAATDEKLAKKLQRLQRNTQRRQKIQQQQQQYQRQQQQQVQQMFKQKTSLAPAQQSASVSLRSLPNHLCNDDCMEVLLGTVDLQRSVIRCEFWPGDTFGEAVLHLDSADAADKCIEYFQGRQWGRLRGPPHPAVYAERMLPTASSADMPIAVGSAVSSPAASIASYESHDGSDSEQEKAIREEEPKLSPSRKPLRPRLQSEASSTTAPSQSSSRASSPTPHGPTSPKLRWADIESDDDEDWSIVGF